MISLVQLSSGATRRVAVVVEPYLRLLADVTSIYDLANHCIQQNISLTAKAHELAVGEQLLYDDIYSGAIAWKLLSPIDVPGAPEKLLIAGTGLTHLGSAKERQSMHLQTATDTSKPITDSMRMFEWGMAGGRPGEGQIGIAPEWFYKGTGSTLQPPFAALTIPSHAEDGGEEAEIAGIYLIADDGTPFRIGMSAGNEFSDHKFERRNYLNLAGSKLRTCSIGPELIVGGDFGAVTGEVSIERAGKTLWHKAIETGEENMCHSLANLEHHHFKFAGHRIPGQVHIHFFGAHSLSFGDAIELQEGDWMQVRYNGYGRALRNSVHIEAKESDRLMQVKALS